MTNEKSYILLEKSKSLFTISLILLIYSLISILMYSILGITLEWFGFKAYALTIVPFAIMAIVALFAVFYSSFFTRMIKDNEARELLKQQKRQSSFELTDNVKYEGERLFNLYQQYGSYAVSIISAILIISLVIYFRKFYVINSSFYAEVTTPLQISFTALISAFFSFFSGAFCIGQSREKYFRVLRPVGGWLLFSAFISFLIFISTVFSYLNLEQGYDILIEPIKYIRYFIIAILYILGGEFLLGMLAEIYRPRLNTSWQPPFESKILSLFTEPGGIIKNFANTLDYQFGFKITKTSVYSFAENYLIPLAIIWVLIFWSFTTIVNVESNENAVRERFGKLVQGADEKVEVLYPGIYFKLPWPFENVKKISITRIYESNLLNKIKIKEPEVMLWLESHHTDDSKYLVAAKNINKNSDVTPVALLNVSVSIQYRIKKGKVFDFIYSSNNAIKNFELFSKSAITEYLASSDMSKVLSNQRSDISSDLKKVIQKTIDKAKLGIEILHVNFHNAHPPTNVSAAYQNVIAAKEKKQKAILEAEKEAVIKKYTTATLVNSLKLESESYKASKIKISEAEGVRFTTQSKSYNIMPKLFKYKTYFDFLENDCKNVRKYIFSDSIKKRVYEVNMEKAEKLDLLDPEF